jgi:hypothetical protein
LQGIGKRGIMDSEPRYVELNIKVRISEDEWEILECIRRDLPSFHELQREQEEKGSVDDIVPDPCALFSDNLSLNYGGNGDLFYRNQHGRKKHAEMMECV